MALGESYINYDSTRLSSLPKVLYSFRNTNPYNHLHRSSETCRRTSNEITKEEIGHLLFQQKIRSILFKRTQFLDKELMEPMFDQFSIGK